MIQSSESKAAGYDASKTGMYQRVNLPFDPTENFHEYRFDLIPGIVRFYADSILLAEMQGEEVPSVGGHLILQHWSNGNPLWSGGPPETDAVLSVSYVKAYFNSSDEARLAEKTELCKAASASDRFICPIPDTTAADVGSGGHFFRGSRSNGNPNVTEEQDETANTGQRKAEHRAPRGGWAIPSLLWLTWAPLYLQWR